MKNNNGFTMMEFVVTLTILGILMSIAVPSYHNVRERVIERNNITNMNVIRETFFHYFYQTHMRGNPHFPLTPNNEDNLMNSEWSNVPIDSSYSPLAPKHLFSDGRVPLNSNYNPFSYETWQDTLQITGEIVYYIKISDLDEDSPSYEKSFTHSI